MKQHQPPKLARRFFAWYCGQAKVEDLIGDLDEWFYQNLKTQISNESKAHLLEANARTHFFLCYPKAKTESRYRFLFLYFIFL